MNLNWDQDLLNDFLFLSKFRDPVPSHRSLLSRDEDGFLRLSHPFFSSYFDTLFSSPPDNTQRRSIDEEARRQAQLKREKQEAEEEEAKIYNAFWDAVRRGQDQRVARFLRHRLIPDVDRLHSFGQSNALLDACYYGFSDIVKQLLESGAQVNIVVQARTPLHVASSRGHSDVVRMLLESGADPSPRRATRRNSLRPERPLGRRVAGETPLHAAVREGHDDVVIILLESNADFHQPDTRGFSPFANRFLLG